MFASVLASLALLAPLAAAEVIVNVGVNNTLLFDPPQVFTEPGETITFVFQSNHVSTARASCHFILPCSRHAIQTATLSTFEDPCTAVDGGFDTGFLSNNQTASVRVNGTDPIWMYCRVGMHCAYFSLLPPDLTTFRILSVTVSTHTYPQASMAWSSP
ncbi:hypothetical protein PENSPDRAFT_654816 [Peniophora sp. CONT]|nr:hypothetical protein PENSPDRAFT_654816 [Peniophora sp. CONT]